MSTALGSEAEPQNQCFRRHRRFLLGPAFHTHLHGAKNSRISELAGRLVVEQLLLSFSFLFLSHAVPFIGRF